MNPADTMPETSKTASRAEIAAQQILQHSQTRQDAIVRERRIQQLQQHFDLTFGANIRDYLETACDGLWDPAHPESSFQFWISGVCAELKYHFLSGWTWQCCGVAEKITIRTQLLSRLGELLDRSQTNKNSIAIPALVCQVQQLNPDLADQLSTQISALACEALADFEKLLTEHLDLNVFNTSKYLVGSIGTLARLIAALRNQSVEAVLLEVRYGDNWHTEIPDCLPDWAMADEFPRAILEE